VTLRTKIVLTIWAMIVIAQISSLFKNVDIEVYWFFLTPRKHVDIAWYFYDVATFIEKTVYIGLNYVLVFGLSDENLKKLREDKGVKYTLLTYFFLNVWEIFEYMGWKNVDWGTTVVLIVGFLALNIYFFRHYNEP